MNTTPMIRRIIPLSVGLIAVGAMVGAVWFGTQVAVGVAGGGVVMLLSFIGGGWSLHRAGQAAAHGSTRMAAGLVLLKLPVLGMALWWLFQRFDPIAVVAGGSAVMVSIVLSALAETSGLIRKEA